MLSSHRWRLLCAVRAAPAVRPVLVPPTPREKVAIPQILWEPAYTCVKLFVQAYVRDKTDAMARIRALSAMTALSKAADDPVEINGLLDVYRALDAEDIAPEEMKAKLVTEANEEFTLAKRALDVLSSLKARSEVAAASPRSAQEISVMSEDPLYELAQCVPSMNELEFTTFLDRFMKVCDCRALDERAINCVMSAVKDRALGDGPSLSHHNLVRLLRILQKTHDNDTQFLTAMVPVLSESLDKCDFRSAVRILEYCCNCPGFEEYALFEHILTSLVPLTEAASGSIVAFAYSLVHKVGILHPPLMTALAVNARHSLDKYSFHQLTVILECVYSLGGELDEVLLSNVVDTALQRFATAVQTPASMQRCAWILTLMDRGVPGHREFTLDVGKGVLALLLRKARVDDPTLDGTNAACWEYRKPVGGSEAV